MIIRCGIPISCGICVCDGACGSCVLGAPVLAVNCSSHCRATERLQCGHQGGITGQDKLQRWFLIRYRGQRPLGWTEVLPQDGQAAGSAWPCLAENGGTANSRAMAASTVSKNWSVGQCSRLMAAYLSGKGHQYHSLGRYLVQMMPGWLSWAEYMSRLHNKHSLLRPAVSTEM